MTRTTSNSTKIRRIRSRLRQRLDELLAQKPLPVRQERQAAPQVRLLESRFVLDASAALVGLDVLSSGWEAPASDVQGDPSVCEDVSSQHRMSESFEVSTTRNISEAGQSAHPSPVAGNEGLGLDLDLGLTDGLTVVLGNSGPQADSVAVDSSSVEFDFHSVEVSSQADETAAQAKQLEQSTEGLPQS